MNIYRNFFTSCAVLVFSSLMVSCDQSTDNQSSGLDGNQIDSTVTAAKVGSVALSDGDVHVYKGEVFSLDLTMSDFTVVSEGGGITLRFDPLLLQVNNVDIDEAVWDFINKSGQINNAEGTVSDILFSSYQGVAGDAKVATIEFQSIESGMSTITMETSTINPFAGDGQVLVVTLNTTNVFSN